MLVEEVMDRHVITISPTSSITEALKLLQTKRIRLLPVIDEEKRVIGIVSDRDIQDLITSCTETKQVDLTNEIQTIMSTPVITVHPLDFVEDIARIFYDEKIASLPVVRNNKLVGIITERDMLYTLIHLTGTHVQSSHIEVKVQDKPGVLPEITAIFGNREINITSLLVYPYRDDPKYKILVFRFQTMNPTLVINDIRDAGYILMWPNHIPESKL